MVLARSIRRKALALSWARVRDRDTDEHVGTEHLVHVGQQDRVHEAHLTLDATILVDITQLDDVPWSAGAVT